MKRHLKLVASAFAIAFNFIASTSSHASNGAPPAEAFFRAPDIRSSVLSPGGQYLAMVIPNKNGRYMLVVLDTSDLKKASVLASSDNWDFVDAVWINDQRLLFTSRDLRDKITKDGEIKHQDKYDHTNGDGDVYAVNRDGSGQLLVISADHRYKQSYVGSNIKKGALEANYSFAGTTKDGSDDILVVKRTYNNIDHYSPESTHPFRLNTKNYALTDLLDGGQPKYTTSWGYDTNEVPRIASYHHDGHCGSAYRAGVNSKWEALDDHVCLSDGGFSPLFIDGDNSLFVSASYQGHRALFKYDVERHQLNKEPLLKVDGFDLNGRPIFDYQQGKLIGYSYSSDAKTTVWFDPHMKDLQKKIDVTLPTTTNAIYCGTRCLSAQTFLIASMSDRQPTKYAIYNVSSDTLTELGSSRESINPEQMGKRLFENVKARDGREIPVYVTLPLKDPGTPHPTVVYVHGGPFVRGFSWEWDADAQFLASRGYVVLQPEYRGSTGFGYEHFKAGWKQYGQAMQDDLADVTQWSIKKGLSDPKQIAIIGASYGGYATLMGLIKNPELYHSGVAWSALTDLTAKYHTARDDETQEDLLFTRPVVMGDPLKDAKMLTEYSPVTHASELKQPLLMAHGAKDLRIPIEVASQFYDAVRKTNDRVQWVDYDDEGHGISHEANRIDFWKRVEAFLDKSLRSVN